MQQNVQVGNIQIGNDKIGNDKIGNDKIGNAVIGRMEWPFSVTVWSKVAIVDENMDEYKMHTITKKNALPIATRLHFQHSGQQ